MGCLFQKESRVRSVLPGWWCHPADRIALPNIEHLGVLAEHLVQSDPGPPPLHVHQLWDSITTHRHEHRKSEQGQRPIQPEAGPLGAQMSSSPIYFLASLVGKGAEYSKKTAQLGEGCLYTA